MSQLILFVIVFGMLRAPNKNKYRIGTNLTLNITHSFPTAKLKYKGIKKKQKKAHNSARDV